MRQKHQGFTLIELMIVVVIIGILATCAIPAYQHYVIRARVTEGLTLATSAKLMVAESLIEQRGQEHPVFGLGFRPPAPTENVAAVAIHPETGAITITFTPLAGDGSIIIRPKVLSSGQILWDCKAGSLGAAYRPASCR